MTPQRYFVRWVTRSDPEKNQLIHVGFAVCDSKKFDKIEVAEFGLDELRQAQAVCKLLNSQEEIENGLPK